MSQQPPAPTKHTLIDWISKHIKTFDETCKVFAFEVLAAVVALTLSTLPEDYNIGGLVSKFNNKIENEPEVLWAQRSDKVYLTVSLPDAKDISVKCEEEGFFNFSAVGLSGEPFTFTLQFYDNIAPQGCKTKIGLRNILCSIQKEKKGWWKRLLKSEAKPAPYIKVDWNKWCDEDDEESDSDLASDDDTVYTGENEESSDDDGMLYLPDLEKARGT